MRWRIASYALIALAASVAAMVIYGLFLDRQLQQLFSREEEFIPTRIYSDVSRIAPPQSRRRVEGRLKALGYDYAAQGAETRFVLHSIEYPPYLVPDGHPTLDADGAQITLTFDGDGEQAALLSIQVGDAELGELYLEPELIATLSRGNAEIREIVRFADIPAPVWKAIIAVEDQHFLDHKGFDPKGFARAVWVNLKSLSFKQGGSTISQQLIKNLTGWKSKSILRKANELFLALLMEARYEKDKILERYLNEVYLGQVGDLEVHGVAEGAKYFFGKRLADLTLAESALMAGIIRGPFYYSPYRQLDRAMERQKFVLKKMVETGHIAEEEMTTAIEQTIRIAPPQTAASKAPYFTDFVKAELIRNLRSKMTEPEIISAGFRVYTTLDPAMNDVAQKAVSEGIDTLEKKLKLAEGARPTRLEGALAAVEQGTGQIRALIGGRRYGESTFNRILNMKRQVGSTFKPIVYVAAFEKGEDANGVPYSAGRPVEDQPWTLVYDQGRQKWAPRNYEKTYRGWINLRTALAHSVNTVAAKLGVEVGIEPVIQAARKLGIESDLPEVPSLSLGVAELSPIELLRAYATLANHGLQEELTVLRGITHDDGADYARFVSHATQVVSPGAADLVTDLLQSVFTDGTARSAAAMGFDRSAAGKTGTTSNYRDAWFAGYTPKLTAVVWVGADQDASTDEKEEKTKVRAKRLNLTGGGSALPIWVRFMTEALKHEPPTLFPVSEHLRNVRTDRHTGLEAPFTCSDTQVAQELFVAGHEPKQSSCASHWPASQAETRM